jgi:hypothetical protein
MISTHLPKGLAAKHPMVASQSIHNGMLKTVSHMEATSYIWRWYYDAIRVAITLGRKITTFFPSLVPVLFQLFGLVGLIHGVRNSPSLKKAQVYMMVRALPRFCGNL